MERAMYNSILSGIDLDGDAYFYTNALRCVHDMPYDLKWSRHREAFISSFCCPPNVVRTIAESQDRAAISRDDGIAFLMYGDCRTSIPGSDGSVAVVSMHSDYPWDGEIEFEFESVSNEREFAVYLRVPEWAGTWNISLNGKALATEGLLDKGFVKLQRSWQAGDRIHLSFPMTVLVNESHPMVEETRNHVALTRGPIVYCLESADLPEGTGISDVYVDPGVEFAFEKALIGPTELGVLKGKLRVSKAPKWDPNTLYRERAKT
jgi:DUF1680 family protein